jgi:hypothetical protein
MYIEQYNLRLLGLDQLKTLVAIACSCHCVTGFIQAARQKPPVIFAAANNE